MPASGRDFPAGFGFVVVAFWFLSGFVLLPAAASQRPKSKRNHIETKTKQQRNQIQPEDVKLQSGWPVPALLNYASAYGDRKSSAKLKGSPIV